MNFASVFLDRRDWNFVAFVLLTSWILHKLNDVAMLCQTPAFDFIPDTFNDFALIWKFVHVMRREDNGGFEAPHQTKHFEWL